MSRSESLRSTRALQKTVTVVSLTHLYDHIVYNIHLGIFAVF